MTSLQTAPATEAPKHLDTNSGVTPAQEAPKAPSPKEDPALSSKFAILAKKEKAALLQKRQFEEERKAFEAQKADLESRYVPKDRIKEDPIGLLRSEGYSDDQIAQLLLSGPGKSDPAIVSLQAKLRSLEEKQTQAEQAAREAEDSEYQEAKKYLLNEVTVFIKGNPEFETIEAMDASGAVVDLIEQTLNEDDRQMSVKEAAEEIETFLLDNFALKYAALNKVKVKFQPAIPDQAGTPASKQSQPTQKQTVATLSNSMTNGVAPRKETMKERKARAIAILQGRAQ